MTFLKDNIVPYEGTNTFKLGVKIDDVRHYLKTNKIHFTQSVDPNKGCKPEVPWTYIEIANSITLCFVKDILFEIVFENNYVGKLLNGACIGMNISELERVDPSLSYNDEDEDYISECGYWVEDDLDTEKISSITVFLPEVCDDNFFNYEWVKKYSED